MSYHIYENWVAEKKAILHKGERSFCREGKGIHNNVHGKKNGKWHGPFDTYENAKNFAQSLKNRTVRDP